MSRRAILLVVEHTLHVLAVSNGRTFSSGAIKEESLTEFLERTEYERAWVQRLTP
jgi:hypothetical protein